MYQPKKIIIVGGNAAGPSAAAKAKRVNPNAEVILFEAGEFISTGTCELPYLLSNDIDDYKKIIFFTAASFQKEKGVKVFNNSFVKGINRKRKTISVINKLTNLVSEFEYDKLILTTGSSAVELDTLSYSIENVFSLKSVQDYLKIKKFISSRDILNVLVIGAGYIGLEVADALNSAGYKVSLFDKSNYPLPNADVEIQGLIYDIISTSEINFLPGNAKTRFVITNNSMKEFNYNGLYLNFDLVIVAAGVKPNNWLAEEANLKMGNFGGLVVDNRLKTSDPNIFAAGDNIEVKNLISKKSDYIPLATHAHSFGHAAGENAAGGNQIVDSVLLNSTFKFCNNYIAQVGLNQKQSDESFPNSSFVTSIAQNKVKVMPNSNKVFGKIIFDNYSGLILGASFLGAEEVSGYADIIATMIQNKIPAKNLAKIKFNYTPPLSPFVNLLSILGRKIEEKI
ncbi:MAG: FAD-dependent oxidoreductase [Melioribacteraceae bacterium]|nr:FAD-dependent oxidoreductase [Melioribacteraceae bacterium]